MAVTDLEIWECDRCGAEWKRTRNSVRTLPEQPEGWVGVLITAPPKSNASEAEPRKVLCAECVRGLLDFMRAFERQAS